MNITFKPSFVWYANKDKNTAFDKCQIFVIGKVLDTVSLILRDYTKSHFLLKGKFNVTIIILRSTLK